MTLTLFDGGCFSWKEWTQTLGAEIAMARERGDADDGSRYYEYWLAALEKLAVAKGLTTRGEMLARKDEWDRAARATPHGKPIVLPGR
jgi:nitrile hydratase accessory protein